MAIPKMKSIHLPLLKVIADAGGELSVDEAIREVEAYFQSLVRLINPSESHLPEKMGQPGSVGKVGAGRRGLLR